MHSWAPPRLDFYVDAHDGEEPTERIDFRLLPGEGYEISEDDNGDKQDLATKTVLDKTPRVGVIARLVDGGAGSSPNIAEGSDEKIDFLFTRTGGDISKPLKVFIEFGGTAEDGDQLDADFLVFPAEASLVNTDDIRALDEEGGIGRTERWDDASNSIVAETVIATITPNAKYKVDPQFRTAIGYVRDNTFTYSLEELRDHPVISAAIDQAWADSNPNAANPGNRSEQGFLIYHDYKTNSIVLDAATSISNSAARFPVVRSDQRFILIGNFHTHPNPAGQGWRLGPSRGVNEDAGVMASLGVPTMIRHHQGLWPFDGPNDPNDPQNPSSPDVTG